MAGVRVLYVGVSKELQSHINGLLNAPVISAIDNSEIFFENLEKITDETADFVCISAEMSDITALELAQSLRMQAPNSQIYFIAYQGKFQDVHDLAKNGCNEVYFLPVDETLIRKTLRGIETALAGEPVERMEAVPLVDLEPNTALDFESSIYLPMNNKYVKVNRKGQAIKESHFNRMKEQAISQIYINEQDLSKFLSYTTQRLKKLSSGAKSTFEEKQKLQSTIRNLFQDLMTSAPTTKFEDGKEFVAFSQKIVTEFVGTSKARDLQKELAAKLSTVTNDLYDRSGRVSTVAALFSMGAGIGSPETAAIAGLFMDFGLGLLPPEIAAKTPEKMTPEEFEIYAKHPLDSVKILQERKMVLTPDVMDGILQHHERFDGKGFPKKLPHHRIGVTGQLLFIADRFVTLSELKPGQAQMSPINALNEIQKEGGASPELIQRLREVFAPPATAAKPA